MPHSQEDMMALFDSFDKNDDGKVSIAELKAGIKDKFCPDITDGQACAMFVDFDSDGNEHITREEFLDQMCDKVCRKVAFNKTFKEWDKDNSGALSFDEVKSILQQHNYDDEKIEGMYQTCDKDGDGKVTCEEFLKLM